MSKESQNTRKRSEFPPITTSVQKIGKLTVAEFVGGAPCVPDEIWKAQYDCTDCQDTGRDLDILLAEKRLAPCACVRRKKIEAARLMAIENTPLKFRRDYRITDGLKSLNLRFGVHPALPQAIKTVKAEPDANYFIWGMPGTQKTTIALALMQEAGKKGKKTSFGLGSVIIKDFREFEINQIIPEKRLIYSVEQLETNEPMCIVIDELEDTLSTLSYYSLSTLFKIIDNSINFGHQLIFTSNERLDGVLNRWNERDPFDKFDTEKYAERIGRRIKENVEMIAFEDYTLKQNRRKKNVS